MKKSISSRLTKALVAIIVLVLLFVLDTGCSQDKANEVTFQQLLSEAAHYDGKEVTVEGFYFHGFEVVVITESLKYSGYAEGHLVPKGETIWIEGEISKDIYDSLYQQEMMGPAERFGKVRITGRFEHSEKYGHLGEYNFRIIPAKVELLEWSPPTL
jgi:hypothetical protein